MKTKILTILIIILTPICSKGQWVDVTSGMVSIQATNVYSDGLNYVFATSHKGVYRSLTLGKKWDKLPLNDSLSYKCILAQNNHILAGGNGLYYSSDYGQTFITRINRNRNINSMTFTANILLVARSGAIIRSTDFGVSWIDTVSFNEGPVIKLLSRNNIIVAGLEESQFWGDGGIYVSTNSGNSWHLSNLEPFDCNNICSTGNYLFTTNGTKVYRSSDNGFNWIEITHLPTANINSINTNNNDLYITDFGSLESVLYKSTDDGVNWFEVTDAGNVLINSMTRVGSRIFAGTAHGGIYHSDDNGNSWGHYLASDEAVTDIKRIGTRLIAGVQFKGMYYSLDSGETWIQTKMRDGSPLRIASLDSLLFAGFVNEYTDTGGVYKSTDIGNSWTITGLRGRTVGSIYTVNNAILAGEFSTGIRRSDDYGNTWAGPFAVNYTPHSFVEHNGKIFAGLQTIGIYFSSNFGHSWLPTTFTNSSVKYLASNSTHIFAATSISPGLYYSTDNGSTWEPRNFPYGSIRLMYTTESYLFAGVNNGVLMSTDNGISWRYKNDGFETTNLYINSFEEFGNDIFVATLNGIYKSPTNYLTNTSHISTEVPSTFKLYQNYPNPFNPSTKIKFDISEPVYSSLVIYDILGKEVSVLLDKKLDAGTYSIEFDARGLPSGIYFYRLTSGDYSEVKRMTLLK